MIDIGKQRCVKYRKRILQLSLKLGALHIAPAFSCLEIVDAIYHKLMRHDGNSPPKFLDTFILSKGHGALVYAGGKIGRPPRLRHPRN